MKKTHLLSLVLLASLLTSCFLIPDQKLSNLFNISGEEVSLTGKRVVYVNSTSLVSQQTDVNVECQISPLPTDCAIEAATPPQDPNELVIVRISDLEDDLPLDPKNLYINIGFQQELRVIVPDETVKTTLPTRFTLREASITLNLFDGSIPTDALFTTEPDIADLNAKADTNLIFTLADDTCSTLADDPELKSCIYRTASETEDILEFRLSDIDSLIEVLGPESNEGATITGSGAIIINNLVDGDFPFGEDAGTDFIVILDEGDTITSFR